MHSPKAMLALSVPLALSSGTLFVYSVYGTQLAANCGLDSSAAANLNIAATIGSAIGGVAGGWITDSYGTRPPLIVSILLVTGGYKWLHSLYLQATNAKLSCLVALMFLIGLGSTAGYFAAIKAVTIAFPTKKGSAQSVTIALFAISSMIYSFIASHFLHGNLPHFLLFLSLSALFLQSFAVVFINVPGHQHLPESPPAPNENTPPENVSPESEDPLIPLEEPQKPLPPHASFHHLNLRDCLLHPIFWSHFSMVAVFQGLGQMYIYCVGYILKAVYDHYQQPQNVSSSTPLSKFQALHVSLIALASFAGRISSGPLSDHLVRNHHFQRHWVLLLATVLMLTGHLLLGLPTTRWCSSISSANAWILFVSVFIGYAYGLGFTTFPAIIADLFHMKNYSLLWGLVYSSTVVGLTIFTKLFGYVFDSNSSYSHGAPVCLKGSDCYISVFHITSGLSLIVIIVIFAVIHVRSMKS